MIYKSRGLALSFALAPETPHAARLPELCRAHEGGAVLLQGMKGRLYRVINSYRGLRHARTAFRILDQRCSLEAFSLSSPLDTCFCSPLELLDGHDMAQLEQDGL